MFVIKKEWIIGNNNVFIIYFNMDQKTYKYISKQTNNPITERKKCKISWQDFPIFQSDVEFLNKISPKFWDTKYQIPFPTVSPKFRHMRRMLFRNDRSLYSRKCDATNKNIICMYAPDKSYKVYDSDYRRSDNRSAFDYGFDFDFSKTFNEQFDQLLHNVPMPAVLNSNAENSTYINQTWNMKNSYLVYSCMDSEDCYYGNRIFDSKKCIDCSVIYNCENCYECIDGHNLYQCFFCQNTKNSSNSYFLFDCIWCKDCFWCRNLREKQYCIFNQQYTQQEYEQKSKELIAKIWSYSQLKELKKYYKSLLKEDAIYRDMYLDDYENSFGWFLYNSKNTIECYEWWDLEYCTNGLMLHNAEYIQDWNNSTWAQWQYEVSTWWINGYNCVFSLDIRPNNSNVLYSAYTPNCSNLFGCAWLKNQSYCIFNKQYTKQEYNILVPKIIDHMQKTWERWEFFHPSISPFWYNESAAFEYFPLTEDKSKEYWFPWYDLKQKQTSDFLGIDDSIHNIDESILEQILICEELKRPFKIIKQEFNFYKKYNISIPRLHSDIRHLNRFNQKPDRDLHLIDCKKCNKEILSVYNNDNCLNVYCENCYNKVVY